MTDGKKKFGNSRATTCLVVPRNPAEMSCGQGPLARCEPENPKGNRSDVEARQYAQPNPETKHHHP
jgi:hypothetical protein